MAENSKVILPRPCSNSVESSIEMIRNKVMEKFKKYRKRECNKWGEQKNNLTRKENRGLRELKQRVKDGEIVILKTDKSGKLTVMKLGEYDKLGKEKCLGDKKIEREEIRRIERRINDHTKMWCKMLNSGANHDHLQRIISSKKSSSENTAPKYLMYEDHKLEGG